MNDIFNPYVHYIIVYIDALLIYSNNLDQHIKHLNQFYKNAKTNGIVLSQKKMFLAQVKIKYLGHDIENGVIRPIHIVIEF